MEPSKLKLYSLRCQYKSAEFWRRRRPFQNGHYRLSGEAGANFEKSLKELAEFPADLLNLLPTT